MFFFHLKSSFRSQYIKIFVFPSSPLFLPVSHCFRAWSKKDLKVYDVINCLNKSLITQLDKEKRYGIKTLSIDKVLNKEHLLWKNHAENVHQKVVRDPFFILANNPISHCMQEILLKIRYFERELSKTLKKLTLFFLLSPVPFNE